MTRDWLLTLLVVSPIYVPATIMVLALIRVAVQQRQGHPASTRWRRRERSRRIAGPAPERHGFQIASQKRRAAQVNPPRSRFLTG